MKAKNIPTMAEFKLQRDRELEERKKKKNQEAANYFLAAQEEQKKAAAQAAELQEQQKNINNLLNFMTPEQKKKLPEIYNLCTHMLERVEVVKKVKEEFFSIKEHPQAEEIKKDMEKAGLEEKSFATIALCATEGLMEKVQKHFSNIYKKIKGLVVSKDVFTEDELAEVKSSSVEKARLAISAAAKGDPEKLAVILRNGLENCCKRFADNRISNEKAMEWSENAAEILYMLDKNPKLMESAKLSETQLECARRTAQMGIELRSGLQAIELMAQVQQQGSELGDQRQNELMDKVVQMQTLAYDRSQFIKMWDDPELATPQVQNTMR